MANNCKKIIAREWLYLLGGVVGGVILVAGLALMGTDVGKMQDSFFFTLLGFPYALCQLIRSILWSIRKLKNN